MEKIPVRNCRQKLLMKGAKLQDAPTVGLINNISWIKSRQKFPTNQKMWN